MSLIDRYLPRHDFRETHSREVAASPEKVMEAAAGYQPDSDPFFQIMIALRELPTRMSRVIAGRQATPHVAFGLHNFVMLEHRGGQGLVYGLIGQFWKPGYGLVTFSDGEAFLSFNEPGVAKLAVGFAAIPLKDGKTKLVTETRVSCSDEASRRMFTPYWYLIRPVSGLIRRRVLASIKRAAERTSRAA